MVRLQSEKRRLISHGLTRIDSSYTRSGRPESEAQGKLRADRQPYGLNAPGPFYSVKDCCIICLAPECVAPDLMGLYEDPSGTNARSHCFFKKQPETPEEIDQAIAAMEISCVENLRYAGDDPAILKRLCELGWRHLCDAFDKD
jgi:hypothetical protein